MSHPSTYANVHLSCSVEGTSGLAQPPKASAHCTTLCKSTSGRAMAPPFPPSSSSFSSLSQQLSTEVMRPSSAASLASRRPASKV